uniref:Uncharacterized protein n=1 Tax=Trichogramma kaykai TaxID=54128 RepID=A0ABD2X8S1_9HYME
MLRAYQRETIELREILGDAFKKIARIDGPMQIHRQLTEEELRKIHEQWWKVEKARRDLEDHKSKQEAMETFLTRDLVVSDSSAEEKRNEFMQTEKRLRAESE